MSMKLTKITLLTDTYYETTRQKPSVVGITSASSGTISPINPPLKVYRDSTVEFDVSDGSLAYTKQASSYAAFALNFYRDKSSLNFMIRTMKVQYLML